MSSTTSSCLEGAASPEKLCYIPCSFCNIVLVVSVPCRNLFDIVTVRCGHCANLWSVNMGATAATGFHHSSSSSSSSSSSNSHDHHVKHQDTTDMTPKTRVDLGSSPRYMSHPLNDQKRINPPPEKKTRVPSAYNHFIKQEIQRIKANEPNLSHREAFSAAAKNWAHFPHMNFGMMLDANNHEEEPDEPSYVQGSKKRPKSRPESSLVDN